MKSNPRDGQPADVLPIMQNILVPLDFSDATEPVLEAVTILAKTFGSTVRLLYVGPPDPAFASSKSWPQEVRDELARELYDEHQQLEELVSRLRAGGINARAMMNRGGIVDTIIEIAVRTNTDLIVLGSRTHGAFFHLAPRSVVKGLLGRAPCPVLTIPVQRHKSEEEEDQTVESRS